MSVHALSLLAAWLNPLPIWMKMFLSAGILASLWFNLGQGKNKNEIIGLRLKPNGAWDLHTGDENTIEAALLGSSLFNPWFVLLHFRTEKKRQSILICRDSLDPDAFRRLRVALQVAGKVDATANGI